MAPLKRARMRQAQVTGNRRSRSRIIRKIIELRKKALSTMRSDKVNTDLCEVTVLRRSDCKQKCHLSGASARCFEVRAVTLLIRSTTGQVLDALSLGQRVIAVVAIGHQIALIAFEQSY